VARPNKVVIGSHPAKYSEKIAATISGLIEKEHTLLTAQGISSPMTVLDPFGGEGTIHSCVTGPLVVSTSVEIEQAWVTAAKTKYPASETIHADSVQWANQLTGRLFDVLATSVVYPNGVADPYVGEGGTPRNTYASHLGHLPSAGSSAGLGRWSNPRQRSNHQTFNEKAFAAFTRILRPGGLIILNTKDVYWSDEYGTRRIGPFSAWMWMMLATNHGYTLESVTSIPTRGLPQGSNWDQRTGLEYVACLRNPK
jgi:hypothetical protein